MNSLKLVLVVFAIFSTQSIQAQTQSDSTKNQALNLYLNCDYCFDSFLKTEIKCVNYVRDRQDADVDLLITSQMTGSSGTEYELFFIGNKKFFGVNDTLKYMANSVNTEDDTRNGLVQVIQIGLMRYVGHSCYASRVKIALSENQKDSTSDSQVIDPWKSWVFNIGGNANLTGEKSTNSQNYTGSFSANRTTEKIKIDFNIYQNYGSNIFIYGDSKIISISKSLSSYAQVVKSINEHWSYGVIAGAGSGTYNNKKLYYSGSPALEYNVFKYSESQRKQFTMAYYIGPTHTEYIDTTIYDKIEEDYFQQRLNVSLSVRQPWGSLYLSATGTHMLNDFQKNNVTMYASADLRLFKGLSLNFYMSYELVHDQISLPRFGASEEELLLHRKEIETSYRFSLYSGITYRFGSMYNNVVNTRLSGGI